MDLDKTTPRKPLRLWPGVIAAALVLLLRFVVPLALPDATIIGVMAALAGALVIVLWWLFFSRAPWSERLLAIFTMVLAVFATRPFLDRSITGAMMGNMFFVYAVPSTVSLAFVAWAVASRRSSARLRRATMVAAILLGCGVWTLARTDGVKGDGVAQLAWRWTTTPEERLLAASAPAAARGPDEPAARAVDPSAAVPAPRATTAPANPPAGEPAAASPATSDPGSTRVGPAVSERGIARVEWTGFRGPDRNSLVRGVRIETDWSARPPVELWRRPIGPGWSSFAVQGDRIYTQEQRGEYEVVASYDITTGELVWAHRDAVRFWESNAGAGPRATPALADGRVYTLGATGLLNALDARDGSVAWSRNAASDTGRQVPEWGFSSSPLIVDDVVVVYVGGFAAYDRATGSPRWTSKGRGSYSSPHLVTINGVQQILQLAGDGATSVVPTDGTELWKHSWPGTPIVQPALVGSGDILITTADMMGGLGVRRIAVAQGSGGWTVEERWTSRGLKPYFNDYVLHRGHAFGFDGSILACIELQDGQRKWKGGRYGQGQLVLLPDQDLLIVLSEDGELALVSATPDTFTELARVAAIEGKTWNHPVLAGDVLLVRNAQEMAAFRLALADR